MGEIFRGHRALQWLRGKTLPAVVKDCFYYHRVAPDPLSISRGLAEVHNLHRGPHRDDGDQHIMNIIIKK